MKKEIYLLGIILFFITSCQQNEVIKTHGVAYLKKREKLIIVDKTNKNGNTKSNETELVFYKLMAPDA